MTTLRATKPVGTTQWLALALHTATFGCATAGLIWRLYLTLDGYDDVAGPDGTFPSTATRVIRYVSYFTIQSNILVAVSTALLVLNVAYDARWWRVVRVAGLYGIAVTGVIYYLLLRDVGELHGQAIITNALLHYWTPPLAVAGWLLFGPFPRIDFAALRVSFIWPACYVAYTLIHGAFSHWYPYPFVNVNTHGYPKTIVNGVLIIGFLALLSVAMMTYDRRRGRTADNPEATPDPATTQ